MAIVNNAPNASKGKMTVSTTGLAASGDATGAFQVPPRCKKISAQALGTFAGGMSIRIEGSNDGGVTWADLGVTAFTAAALRDVPVFPDLMRAASTAGSASDVAMHFCLYFD